MKYEEFTFLKKKIYFLHITISSLIFVFTFFSVNSIFQKFRFYSFFGFFFLDSALRVFGTAKLFEVVRVCLVVCCSAL